MPFSKTKKKDTESIKLSVLVEYNHLRLLNLFNSEKLFVCDIHSRFALYHAFARELEGNIHAELTSKFLMSTCRISFPTSFRILSSLQNLGFLTKHRSTIDKRTYKYKITHLGKNGVMLWESFRVHDLGELKKLDNYHDGFSNMTKKRIREIRRNWLRVE